MARTSLSNKPDPILVKDQLQALQDMRRVWGTEAFAASMIWILGKKEDTRLTARKTHSRLIPFQFNPIQREIQANIAPKNICLKPRQIGLTTWFLLIRLFMESLLNPGTNGFLISQSGEKASEHFHMLKRAYKYIGALDPSDNTRNVLTQALHKNLLHYTASNRKMLILDQLDCSITIGSAEVEEVGQGSTLARVVCSEVARWPGKPEETLANLKEAIPLDGTLDLESTANGMGGYFCEEYFRAKGGLSEFRAHFHQWWLQPEYRIELTDKQKEELEKDLQADEENLRKLFHLQLEQIAFRREKQKSLRHNFEEKYPEDDVTCFLISGTTFVDKDILRARLLELTDYKPEMSFLGGQAKIFQKRIVGRRYIIGADPASGKLVGTSELDYSAAKVIDEETGEEVAMYKAQLSPEDFALDLEELGRYYNNALIAVERGVGADAGGDGGTVLLTLSNQQYPNIYKHKEWFRRFQKTKVIQQEGLPMNGRTRPVAVNKMRFVLENNPELIWDIELIREAMVFVRDEKGRPTAAEGEHDDMFLASSIAQLVRMIVLGYWDPLLGKGQKYGESAVDSLEPEEIAT